MGFLSAFGSKKRVHLLFDDHYIRYLETNEPSIHAVKAFGEKELPSGLIHEGKIVDPEGLTLILEQCVEEWKLNKKKVSFIIPNAYILIRQVDVPVGIKEDEIKAYLYLEIGMSIHLPFDRAILDFIIIGQDEAYQQIVLIAAPEELVSQYSSLLEKVKLQPTVADVSAFANYRLYHRLGYVQENEHLLELQIDSNSMNICVFHQNQPKFFRHIYLNTSFDTELGREVSATVDLEVGELESHYANWLPELLAELERIVNFYHFSVTQGKYTINRIMLTGTHPSLKQVRNRIEKVLQIPVKELDTESLTTITNQPIPVRYYSLLGLALREVN